MEDFDIKYVHLIKDHNLEAPREIVPYLVNIFHPQSVVDVGCGLGTFLNIFLENGVHDLMGIDGSWVNKSKLFVPQHYIVAKDLEQTFQINRKYDLVLCLEVAEHLSENAAETLIENLTNLGDIIIFSAAIVNQGGQNHVNEQHFHYWIEKFRDRGFVFHDIFRNHFWDNPNVDWWYKQNMFLVANKSIDVSKFTGISDTIRKPHEYVHPDLLSLYAEQVKNLKENLKRIKEGKASPRTYFQFMKKSILRKFSRSR